MIFNGIASEISVILADDEEGGQTYQCIDTLDGQAVFYAFDSPDEKKQALWPVFIHTSIRTSPLRHQRMSHPQEASCPD